MAQALTLHEASKHRTGVVKAQAIVKTFEESSALLRMLPFMDIKGDAFTYNVEEKLPAVGYRGYNEGFDTSIGIINPQTERLSIVGGDVDVDRRLVMTRGEEVRSEQEMMTVRSAALKISSDFIKGDSDTDPRAFDGLRKRITGDQLFSPDAANPANNAPLSISRLMKAIDETVDASAIILSHDMRRRLQIAAQANLGGSIEFDKDEFGYRVMLFDQLPLITLGRDNDHKHIIDFNEAGPGGGNTSTSVYVVSFSPNGVKGLQNGGILVDDLGEIDDKPVYRTRIEWQVGMAVMSGYSASRIWGITDAPVIQ